MYLERKNKHLRNSCWVKIVKCQRVTENVLNARGIRRGESAGGAGVCLQKGPGGMAVKLEPEDWEDSAG